MSPQALRNAASVIVARNLTKNVVTATVSWDEKNQLLELQYFVAGAIGDKEQECCEVSLAELAAEFPDILKAETACLDEQLLPGNPRGEVIFRRG
ncbi:hypothetical protein ACSFBI_33630 [Variovorax sp. RB3P1]|uniref:hypothetical protein n=1 Tax=Variovorax sp. RB3P1 TaxID=3443732 RepID=UPI003F488566